MRIMVVTDAWSPQVNGIVVTLENTIRELQRGGHDVGVVPTGEFRTWPCPTYPEIRLALFPGRRVAERIEAFDPDAIHIATEGPLGSSARRAGVATGRSFTTADHTQFPEYVHARLLPARGVAAGTGWRPRPRRPCYRSRGSAPVLVPM